MAFKDFPDQRQGVELLQRSLERGRLGHAYLFAGQQLDELEGLARTLAKTLNCQRPRRRGAVAVDCCDECPSCQKIEHGNHPDVHWLRPESKLRLIKIDQMVERPTSREKPLLDRINLRTFEAEYKVAVIVAADRMNEEAANAFLKTLEEPPPKSVLVLVTTRPERILDTISSRCLRLSFGGERRRRLDASEMAWLSGFSDIAAVPQKSLLGRYRLLDVLVKKLNESREKIDKALTARSPSQRYPDAEKELQEKWEEELKAAIEAEYRRQRADLLLVMQWWLRDVWLETMGRGSSVQSPESRVQSPTRIDRQQASDGETSQPAPSAGSAGLLNFPELSATRRVAERLSGKDAVENLRIMEQLQRWLGTNVQEALALEVGLLKLHL